MTSCTRSFTLFFVMVLILCHTADAQSWQVEIESLLAAQSDEWNRGSIEGYMEGYWKSDSLLFTSGGKEQRGWKATFDKYSKSYDTRSKMGRLSFSTLEFHRLTPDAAWVFGRWALHREGDTPGGVFTIILREFSHGWKIVHDHTSSFPPITKTE